MFGYMPLFAMDAAFEDPEFVGKNSLDHPNPEAVLKTVLAEIVEKVLPLERGVTGDELKVFRDGSGPIRIFPNVFQKVSKRVMV